MLAELVTSLRLESVVLVGHSLGAWVACSYALHYPEQVDGLCIIEPEGLVYSPKRWRQERWWVSPLGGLWLAITKLFARKSTPEKPSTWLQNYHVRQRLKQHPAACQLLFQRRRPQLEAELVGSRLATLSMPIVALDSERGDNQKQTCRELTQTFTTATPKAMVKQMPSCDEHLSDDEIAMFLTHWLPTL